MSWNRRGKFKISEHKDTIIIGLLVFGIVMNIFSSTGSEKLYVLSNGKPLEEPELNQFCTSFIDQILSRNLQKEMVAPDIYDVLVGDNYKELKLVGSEVPLFSRANGDSCSVIIKDKLGLRRFDIWVNSSLEFPFYYQIQKIDEPLVEG